MVVFLIATAGLLGWALVKPFVEKLRGSRGGGYEGIGEMPRTAMGREGYGVGDARGQRRAQQRREVRDRGDGDDT